MFGARYVWVAGKAERRRVWALLLDLIHFETIRPPILQKWRKRPCQCCGVFYGVKDEADKTSKTKKLGKR